jgi:mannose-6-phosphate isomerase-like protein (cupin superfamily)
MHTTLRHVTKSIDAPDELREFPNGFMKVLDLGDEVVGYGSWEPGWQWSKDMKAKVGTDSCQVNHNLFCISGRMLVTMDNGDEFEIGPGDAAFIAPGHDAKVLGNEPCVCLDWTGARTYAK